MRCKRCGQTAWVDMPRHNTALCQHCFPDYLHKQVTRAIHDYHMLRHGEPVMVAVSGGKDSMTLWQVLLDMGYQAVGVHIDLGIGDYSRRSREVVATFAAERGVPLTVIEVAQECGLPIPSLARRTMRSACSACGLVKRYLLNRAAREAGATALATGHNLDDEAATLLGNLMRWQAGYLQRQAPALPGTYPGLVSRVKPLYRVTEKETASYAVIRRIPCLFEECPLSRGSRSLLYKEALNRIEAASPGSKQGLVYGFLETGKALLGGQPPVELQDCVRCGQPSTTEVCAYCRLLSEVGATAG